MSYNPDAGFPLITDEALDDTFGPFPQGNNGTFYQRNPVLFTVTGTFDGASLALMTITPESSTLVAVLDDAGDPVVWTAPGLLTIKALPGGYPLYLDLTDSDTGTEVSVSIGMGNATGYLVSP